MESGVGIDVSPRQELVELAHGMTVGDFGEDGGQYWAIHASLIETAKMNDVDPQAYLADVPPAASDRHVPVLWYLSGLRSPRVRTEAMRSSFRLG